ncbi:MULTISPECIES: hypothetical protein [unclassified Maridesulfovibrio]|uniref:hypothetical protein n=1 Tax=unclassified Maridesulfovibrio TaxID=2794999 RepID=UPI003B3C940A
MDSKGIILTKRGDDLMKRALTGTLIQFSHVEYGTGVYPEDVKFEELESLVDSKLTLPIQEIKNDNDGTAVLTVAFTNSGLAEGFSHTETGIYADDPIHGKILYAVHYASAGGYIPPGGSAYIVEDVIDYMLVVGRNVNVAATINNMVVLATKVDIDDHNTDPKAHDNLFDRLAAPQPLMLAPATGTNDVGATPLLRCSPHATILKGPEHYATRWLVAEAADTEFLNPIHDSGPLATALTLYELPGGIVTEGNQFRSTCEQYVSGGLISDRAEATLWTTRSDFVYVKRPSITAPLAGATNVQERPDLSLSGFAVVGGADTHVADQYQIKNDTGDVIWTSSELSPGVSYKLLAGLLKISRDYEVEGRQRGEVLGWSEWSVGAGIRTAAAFIVTDEAAYIGQTWLEYVQASAAGVALNHGAILRSNPVLQGQYEANWVAFAVRVVVRGTGLELLSGTKVDELETPDYIAVGDTVLTEHGSGVVESVTETDTSGVVDFFGDSSGVDVWNFNDSLISQENRNIIQAAGLVGYEDMKIGKGVVLNDSLATSFSPFQTAANNLFSFSWFMPNIVDANSSMNYMTDSQGDHMSYSRVYDSTVEWVTRFSGSTINIPRPDPADFPFLHLALIITNNKVSRYINGSLIGEAVVDFTSQTVRIMGPESNTGSRNLRMDQLRWFNRALTVEEIGQLMQETGIIRRATIPALSGVPSRAHILPKIAVATGAANASFVEGDYAAVAIESATLVTDDDPTNPQAVVIDTAKVTPAAFRQIAVQVEPPEGSETRANEVVINLDKEGS